VSWEAIGAIAGVAGTFAAIVFGLVSVFQARRRRSAKAQSGDSSPDDRADGSLGSPTEARAHQYDDAGIAALASGTLIGLVLAVGTAIWENSVDLSMADRNDCISVKRQVDCDDPSAQYKISNIYVDEEKGSKRCDPLESTWVERYSASVSGPAEPALFCLTPLP
jgi:hypothetical protein